MRAWSHAITITFVIASLDACSSDDPKPAHEALVPGDGHPDAEAIVDGQVPDDEDPSASKVNTTTETISVDGATRRFILSVPKNYVASRSYPLILALHGDGQDAAAFAASSKIEAFSGDEAIVAYTDGSVDLFTPYEQNTDQKLIEYIITALKLRFSIDGSKIWGFGYSKGAYQLNEIACKKPGLLTAMAIHAGGAPQTRDANGNVDCPKAIGLAVFVTHGANDDPGGGEFGAAYWASRAGCQETRSPSTPNICEAYDGCNAGTPVVFCVVPNQSHSPLYKDAASHSWAWFKTLSL